MVLMCFCCYNAGKDYNVIVPDNRKNMKKMRKYYPESFEIITWENLEKELKRLLEFEISSVEELITFWETVSELTKILEDKVAWLYISMTRFADKPENRDAFNEFMSKIIAKGEPYQFKLKKKFFDNPFRKDLPDKFDHLGMLLANEIELFREENVALSVKEQELSSRYGEMTSKMTALFDGEEKTMQQLASYLESPDRKVREKTWRLRCERYMQDQVELDKLFDELKEIRKQIAKNAGFDNYRDYIHQEKGRFSYTPENLLELHQTIEKVVVPFICDLNQERADKLGIEKLKPWDFDVDICGENSKIFNDHNELIEKGIKTIDGVDPIFSKELERMRDAGFLDLENRKGKAPGGYCYTLYEDNSSFIFMHAVGIKYDLKVFVHEAGHAMHNIMSKSGPIYQYTSFPSEVAELASMSMELISFAHWDNFYAKNKLNLIRRGELADKLRFIPWGVAVDAFQHWIYTNPDHTPEERAEYFSKLLDRFKIAGDWSGLEKEKAMRWMMQLHIFEVPFYYIEYVLAQLGAIGIYKNYRENSQMALEKYKNFLKVGYSKSVTETYETAGIPFDFSEKYIKELIDFVRDELKKDF